jgi:hypothetical protein
MPVLRNVTEVGCRCVSTEHPVLVVGFETCELCVCDDGPRSLMLFSAGACVRPVPQRHANDAAWAVTIGQVRGASTYSTARASAYNNPSRFQIRTRVASTVTSIAPTSLNVSLSATSHNVAERPSASSKWTRAATWPRSEQ